MNRLIIDTREPFEYTSGHVSGSVNIPLSSFSENMLPAELDAVDLNTEIIVYCRTGNRSNVVANILKSGGFTNVLNGINASKVNKLIGTM